MKVLNLYSVRSTLAVGCFNFLYNCCVVKLIDGLQLCCSCIKILAMCY